MKHPHKPTRTTAQKAQALATSTAELGACTREGGESASPAHPRARSAFTALGAAATAAALTAPDVDATVINAGGTPFSVGPAASSTRAFWSGLGGGAFTVGVGSDRLRVNMNVKAKSAAFYTTYFRFLGNRATGAKILSLSSMVGPSVTASTYFHLFYLSRSQSQYGALAPDTDGYVGFHFDTAAGDTLYGWARMSYSLATDTQTSSFRLLEAFYEDSGAAIHVGDRGASVPASGSSLGFLAIGLAGLEFWRRRQKKEGSRKTENPAS